MVKIANRALQVYHKIAQNFYLDIDERVKEEVTKLLEIKDNFPPSFGMLSQTLSDIELISGNIHQSEECLNFTYDPDLDYDPEDL